MMDKKTVWYHCAGGGESERDVALARTLVPERYELCRLNGSVPPRSPGLVFFPRASDAVCEWLSERANGSGPIFAIATNPGSTSQGHVWRLLCAGASDVFCWGEVSNLADVLRAKLDRWHDVESILAMPAIASRLVGKSRAWQELLRRVVEIARFTDDSLLVTGESGTGKELVAHLVHDVSERAGKNKPLVVVDCTTIAPDLAGSEFFGHERGAFTGAIAARDGAFAAAHGGTLFLDEIGELPMPLQAQLLRVLQERVYRRIGSNGWLSTDFRLVCATNRDLEEEVRHGRFRSDLYYRISAWSLRTPPLRERTEDILPLAEHFLAEAIPQSPPPQIDAAVREYLLTRSYPGNVRDLRLLVFRLAHRHVGPGPITVGDVPNADRPQPGHCTGAWLERRLESAVRDAVDIGVGLKRLTQLVAQCAVRIALEKESNLHMAARRLGVTDRALQMRRASDRYGEQNPMVTSEIRH